MCFVLAGEGRPEVVFQEAGRPNDQGCLADLIEDLRKPANEAAGKWRLLDATALLLVVRSDLVERLVLLVQAAIQVVGIDEFVVQICSDEPWLWNANQGRDVDRVVLGGRLQDTPREPHASRLPTDLAASDAASTDLAQVLDLEVSSGQPNELQLVRQHALGQHNDDFLQVMLGALAHLLGGVFVFRRLGEEQIPGGELWIEAQDEILLVALAKDLRHDAREEAVR
jgi:hypothetical protein